MAPMPSSVSTHTPPTLSLGKQKSQMGGSGLHHPSHHGLQISSAVHQQHSSPSRTYSLSKASKNSSSSSLLSSSTVNNRSLNKLSSPPSRPTKAFTYSVPRNQPRYMTTNHPTLSQHQLKSPNSSIVKTPGSPLRSLSVVQPQPLRNPATSSATLNSTYLPSHVQQPAGQRYTATTYRRTGAPSSSPIITSILSPPATQQQQQQQQYNSPVLQSTSGVVPLIHHSTNRNFVYTSGSSSSSSSCSNISNCVVTSSITYGVATESYTSCSSVVGSAVSSSSSGSTSAHNISTPSATTIGNNGVSMLFSSKNTSNNKLQSNSLAGSNSPKRSLNSSSPCAPLPSLSGTGGNLAYIPSPHIPPPPGANLHANALTPLSVRKSQDSKREGISSDDEKSSSPGPSGEETETAPEGEGDEQEDSITRCVCDLTHDDGYMIQCDRCQVWQHVICMELSKDNIPDEYLCEACSPRAVDKFKARTIQMRKRQQISQIPNVVSSSDSEDNCHNVLSSSSKPKPSLKNLAANSSASGDKVSNSSVKKKRVKIVPKMKNMKSKTLNKTVKTKKLNKKSSAVVTASAPHNNNNNNNNNNINSLCGVPEDKEKKILTKASRRVS